MNLQVKNGDGQAVTDKNSIQHDFFLNAPSAMVVLNAMDLCVTSVNDAYLKLLGTRREAVIDKPFYETLPEVKSVVKPLMNQTLANGTPQKANECPLKVRDDDGVERLRYFNFTWQVTRNADRNIHFVIIVATEVTEQVLSRHQIEESENRFRMIANESPAFLFMGSTLGEVDFISRSWLDFTGLTEVEGKGLGWASVTHPDDVGKGFEVYNQGFSNAEPFELELRQRSKGGIFKNVLWRTVPRFLPNGDFYGMLGIGVDISDQRNAETTLRRSEEKYRTLFDRMEQGFCIIRVLFDDDGIPHDYLFLEANPVFEELTGLKSVVGKTAKELVPDLEQRWFDIYGKVASTGQSQSFTEGSEPMGRWFDVFAYSIGNMQEHLVAILFTDVTEKRKSQELLVNSERYFRQLTETIPAIVWITDPSGYCTYLNQNWYQFTAQQENEALGYGWLDATHPDDKELSGKAFVEANAARKSFHVVYRLRRHDGEYRWCTDVGRPKFSQSGEYEGMIGTVVDVHDERIATDNLRKLSAHLQLATTASNTGTWQLDVQTNALTWSDYHKKMWGYDPGLESLVYEDWHRLIFPEDKLEAFDRVATAMKTHSQYEAVYRIKRAGDNEVRWMKSVGRFDYDENGTPLTITGITIDITEERKVLETIRQNEQKFRLLAEKLPQIIWVSDATGGTEYRSSRWHEFFGSDGTNDDWTERCHPQDRNRAESEWKLREVEQRASQVEVRLRDLHGNYRWHRSMAEPIKNDEGNVVKWVGALIDIHDMKALEDHLNELVKQRTSELARSNEDLQQFAHVASHDLKEPVRKVKTFINRLLIEFQADLPEKVIAYLDRIDKASDRMRAMIDGVLEFSLLSTGPTPPESIDLMDVLKTIREDLDLLISERQARFEYNSLHALNGTPILIYQLLYNLVSNSLKFARPLVPTVISITTERLDAPDPVASDTVYPIIRIAFTDNGIGFANSHAEDIFRPFVRLHPKDRFEGTGLGLALCRKIVERHGGTITAESKQNEGATFIIDMPL